MSTTVTSPVTHAQTQGETGHSFVFARMAIMRKLTEMMSALDLGLATMYGDLAGRGSDTVRITHVDGIGYAESFTTLGGETDAVPMSGVILDHDEMSIARHGLGKEMSYQEQILNAGRPEAVDLEMLVGMVPESWLRTLMAKIAATGATITGVTGTSGAVWSVDNEIALRTAFKSTEGAGDYPILTLRHPTQFEQLRAGLRTESALLEAAAFQQFQAFGSGLGRPGAGLDNFLGFNNFESFRVTNDGTDFQGFAWNQGKIGWVVANTSPIRPANPAGAIYVPQYGLIIEQAGTTEQGKSSFVGQTFFGTGLLGDTVRYGRRIRSRNS